MNLADVDSSILKLVSHLYSSFIEPIRQLLDLYSVDASYNMGFDCHLVHLCTMEHFLYSWYNHGTDGILLCKNHLTCTNIISTRKDQFKLVI